MRRLLKWIPAAALAGPFLGGTGYAQTVEEKPLVEIGVIGIGGTFPDYPASAQNHFHALPLPYVIYRGEYVQLAPNSIRGLIVNTDRLTLDISASGAFNSSHDDAARAGMPGLDYMAQLGPRLNILLAHDATDARIDVELPARAVFSTDLKSVAYRGVVMAPELAYTNENFLGSGGRFKFGVGPEFASARLMDYFYAVAPQFVTPDRPQYNATGGYLGSRAELSYRYPIGGRASIIALTAPELYAGATNDKSPLFKKNYGMSAALGFTYSFYASTALATGENDADAEPVSAPKPFKAELRSPDPALALVSTPPVYGVASQAERKIDRNPEPISSPRPLIPEARSAGPPPSAVGATDPQEAAASADNLPQVAQGAADSSADTRRDDDAPAVLARGDATPAAPPAQQREASREKDLTGWLDRAFASFERDPQNQNFVMISDESADPRTKAAQVCARTGLMAVLVKADRTGGVNPDEDKIVWHFSCRY